MQRSDQGARAADQVDAVGGDLVDHERPAGAGKRAVGARQLVRRRVHAVTGSAKLAGDMMRAEVDHDDTAVEDVRGDDVAVGEQDRRRRVIQVVGRRTRAVEVTVAADHPVGVHVELVDHVVVVLGDDQLAARRRDEGVVRIQRRHRQ